MRSTIFYLTAIIVTLNISEINAQSDSPIKVCLHSFKNSGNAFFGDLLIDGEWPKDINGERDCAWIRVKIENKVDENAFQIRYNFNNATIEKIENHLSDSLSSEIWIFVSPSDSASFEVEFPIVNEQNRQTYVKSNSLTGLKFEPKHAYDVSVAFDRILPMDREINRQQSALQDSVLTQIEIIDWTNVTNDISYRFISNVIGGSWPKDLNGIDCAWIRVGFENFSLSEIENLVFQFSDNALIMKSINMLNEKSNDIWLFVAPVESTCMEVLYPNLELSTRLSGMKLESKKVYNVRVKASHSF